MAAQNNVVSEYYSGQGTVLMASRDVAGNPTGFTPIGNCSALSIAIATSVVEHKESTSGARGIDLRLTTEVKASVNVTMESFDIKNLSLGLYGTDTTMAGGAVVSEAVTAPLVLGQTVALAHIGVDTVTPLVLTDTGAVTTYVEGTDYTMNPEVGSINILVGGSIVAGQALEATYNYAAYDQVDALTTSQPERWLRFEGLNTASGNKSVTVDVFKFTADPLAELALISEDIGQIQLAGGALADNTKTTGSKYFRQRILA